MHKTWQQQVNNIYLYTFFSGMMFWYGIEQLFLEEIGDGVFVRGVTLAVFSVGMVISNIPAGAFSDIWGRVKSLKIAVLMMFLALLVLLLSQNVWHYAIGSLLFAFYWSFDEGAKEAFIYDTLVDNKVEGEYPKILGRSYAALLVGAAFANFLSGFIADATSLRTTYAISFIPCVIAFYFVLKLHEPDHHKQVGKKIFRQLDDAFRAIKVHKVLAAIVIAQMLIYTVMSVSQEFAQVAVVEHTNSAILLGFSWGIMGLIMAWGNLGAHKIKNIFLFIVGLLALTTIYYIAKDSWLSLIALFALVAGLEAVGIRGEGAIQNNTTSHLRATISSIPGSVSMLIIAGLAVWIGGVDGTVAFRIFILCFPMLLAVLLIWFRFREHIPKS